ncbi:hypothetical protein MMC25_007253 [Agyrium rufum]|nr:hypothetical protein [Agyrium rufum]
MGYLLHPTIPTTAPDWVLADIGAGNACWTLDVAREVPPSWKLHGFDISSSQYPATQYVPKNVSLGILDAFDEIPADLVAKFDVVHIRAFAAVVKGGDPGPLAKNLVKMLKPGGYLQWDEFDTTTFAAHVPSDEVSKSSTDAIIQVWHGFAKKLDIQLGWLHILAESFPRFSLTLLDYVRLEPTDFLRKAATDNWMMALEEVGFIIVARGGEAGAQISSADYTLLLDQAMYETQRGVSIWIDMQVVLGRK